jgi:hypothetical protein
LVLVSVSVLGFSWSCSVFGGVVSCEVVVEVVVDVVFLDDEEEPWQPSRAKLQITRPVRSFFTVVLSLPVETDKIPPPAGTVSGGSPA